MKKKVSIWDKADPLAKDLVSSAPVAVALGATIASAHRRKAPRTIEDIIDELQQLAAVPEILSKMLLLAEHFWVMLMALLLTLN